MNGYAFTLAGANLAALPSGGLWWPARRCLVVSDLHLGKAERMARRGGALLPPYEVQETLDRLASDIAEQGPDEVICLGDSFDDAAAAAALPETARAEIIRMQAGRRWVWITGNHDPTGTPPGGTECAEIKLGPLTFRHIARPDAEEGEISGHFHPKATLRVRGQPVSRRCFLVDRQRAILPAYGTYTGGLRWTDPAFAPLLKNDARAILTGKSCCALPVPRSPEARQ